MYFRYLAQIGEIVLFDRDSESGRNKMAIVNLQWLCSEVIGPVLAPREVGSVQRLTVSSDATVTVDQVKALFTSARQERGQPPFDANMVDVVIKLLMVFELCVETEVPQQLLFPSRLPNERPSAAWKARPAVDNMLYVGRR